jgi:O-antigen/teichoic acid export membrane protein
MAKNNYLNVLLISWSWIIGGLINYAYHPIMLKFLTIEEFWVFWSLLWMFNILWVLTVWLILFLNKEVSKNIENKGKIKFIFYESAKLLFILSLLIYFVYFIFSWIIANFLNIDELGLIYIVWIAIIIWFLAISEHSVMRWLKKFEFLSFITIIAPVFKLLLWFLLVFFGFKIYWAVIWFILWWVFSLVVSFVYLYNYFKNTKQIWNNKDFIDDFKNSKKDILNFFFVSLFFAILMNIDVILAKNLFDETTAWIYAWLSVLGKFLIFLLLSIETVYYGQIMEHKKDSLPKHLIKNPIFLITIISIIALIFNFFLWEFILTLLKEELASNLYVYLLILVYYSFLAFISFFSKILIGWNKYLVNYIMWFLSILLVVLVYTLWTNLINFVYCFIFIWILGTIITWVLFYKEFKKDLD